MITIFYYFYIAEIKLFIKIVYLFNSSIKFHLSIWYIISYPCSVASSCHLAGFYGIHSLKLHDTHSLKLHDAVADLYRTSEREAIASKLMQ